MQAGEKLSLEQIRAFLEASEGVGFKGRNREEGEPDLARARLPGFAAAGPGMGAAVPVEDDGAEPGADHVECITGYRQYQIQSGDFPQDAPIPSIQRSTERWAY
jgi:hypothetical protein